MLRGIYTSASGMIAQMERQDTIANNLANVNTTGFKKDQSVIKQFPELMLYRKDDEKEITNFGETSILTKIGALGTGASLEGVYTEFSQGSLEKTDNNLDFAISGDGLFAVESKGSVKLTRSGDFALSPEGYLITKNGEKVLGSSGSQLGYIKVSNSNFKITKSGILKNAKIEASNISAKNISLDGNSGDSLLLLKVSDNKNLKKIGDNLFDISNVKTITQDNSSKMEQGFIEHSNVSSIKEMVEMIEVSRAYETNQKVLTSQDETLGKVVNEVGKWG
ncbi:flagellar basal-body rod protein FlgF [Haliovirga abyssi]|uniref:Flagellar basal-body rod protein FlgF n=1 Tax=Haliovirga abyssi TaxID=2996794 RepID=A0AAU9DXV5_9FUSO|nr:flagellar basal-body rod protein FlgF [Haliovirga abyssi]BDU50225.1 flagellar basal-body rod protein FlgF [Haliovirga abyssi]